MSQLAFRSPRPFVLIAALLLLAAAGAAVAQEGPRANPQARPGVRELPQPPAKVCESCTFAHQKCFATCFAGPSKRGLSACLTACDKAAASCSCDAEATLRSEDLVKWGLVSMTKDGCHATSLCPASYSSCASWSADNPCAPSYCQTESYCGDPWCDNGCDPDGGPASHQPYERYRVCFDQFANPCTEWLSYDAVFCGC